MEKHEKKVIFAIAVISVLFLLLIIFMGIKTHNDVSEVAKQECSKQQLLLAKQFSTGIEEFLNEKVELTESIARNHANASPEEFQASFIDIYEGSTGYYALEYINVSGVVVSGYPEENVPIGYNLYENNREYPVEHARDTRGTYCTNPVDLFEGGLGSFIWVPIFDGEEHKGTILGIIQMSALAEKYLEPYDSSSYVYLVDRSTQVLYDGSGQYTAGDNYFDMLNESNPKWMHIIEEQLNGSQGTAEFTLNGKNNTSENKMIAFSPIEWRRRLWSVAVVSPATEVEDIIHPALLKNTVLVLFSASIALLGGFSLILLLTSWNRSLKLEVHNKTYELKQSNEFLEKANQKLKELDGLKSDFVSMVSHELKMPLAAIKTSTELLKDADENELIDKDELIEKILRNVDRQTRMVNDQLDLSRIESGMMNFKKEEVDLHEVISTSIETVEKTAYDLGIGIYTSIPEHLPGFTGNKDALVSVFVNLLNNSLKFTPWGGRIDIDIVELDQYIQATVKDNGIGLGTDDIEKIFEKFYRVGNDIYNNTKGTGLGLTIAKGIVEGHGGTIEVESKEGKGITFTFTIKK
ncbi:MAG: histidine kinase [Methanosarcinales archaeon]|nr:histidine kinase [Methanosarcinales archaeon]